MFIPYTNWRLSVDQFVHVFSTSGAVLLNLLLIYLIRRHSKKLRTYSVVLLCTAVTDLFVALCNGFVMPRLVPVGWTLAYIFHGPCRYFGSDFCFYVHVATNHFIAYGVILIPISFWFRHIVIEQEEPTKNQFLLICFIPYIPSFVTMKNWCGSEYRFQVLFDISIASPESILSILDQNNYTIFPGDSSKYVISGVHNIFGDTAVFLTAWICVPCFPSYCICFFYGRKIVRKLRESSFSNRTKKLQKQLFKALFLQATIQFGQSLVSSFYLVQQLKIPFYEYIPYFEEFFVLLSVISFLNPLITLSFVSPYQQSVLYFCHQCVQWICYRLHLSTPHISIIPIQSQSSEPRTHSQE